VPDQKVEIAHAATLRRSSAPAQMPGEKRLKHGCSWRRRRREGSAAAPDVRLVRRALDPMCA